MTEKMKPSGIAWIGDIPSGWGAKRIKYVISDIKDGTHGTFDRVESGELLLSAKNVFDYGIHIGSNESEISYSDYTSIVANGFPQRNDVLLCCVGTIGRCCVYNFEKPLAFQRSVSFLRPLADTIPSFLKYALQSDSTTVQEQLLLNKSAQEGLYMGSVREMVVAMPDTVSEQRAIADFLDTQCAKIDSVIADIEKQIETLQKYKKSLITETVTRGLDRSVPMKDSGVNRVGKIPSHWSVKRLKYVMNNFDSQRKPIEAQNRSQDGDVLYDYYGASGAIDKIDDYIFDETALLIGEDGANLVLRHLPLIYIATGKYWVNNHAHILRPKAESDLYFMAHQMEIIDYSLLITGSAQPKLSQENLNNVMLVVPPLEEQLEIATFLNQKVTVIDEIIGNKQKQLDAIRQHKKSLIYEYVTGKKRVAEVN